MLVSDAVNSSPSLEFYEGTVEVDIGNTAELPCVASGHPRPAYSWSREGQDLRPNDVSSTSQCSFPLRI